MRKIDLKEVDAGQAGGMQLPSLNYAAVITQILSVKADGMMVPELRKCLGVLAAVEKGRDVVVLEETEWQYLVERIQSHRWPVATPAVMTMIDDICSAAVFDPNL